MDIKRYKLEYERRSTPITTDQYYDIETISSDEQEDFLEQSASALIGQTVISFNALEEALDFILTDILHPKNDELGWVTIKNYSYSQKANLLIDFIKADPQLKAGFSETDLIEIKLILELSGTMRNKIVHGEWEGMTSDYKIRTKLNMGEYGVKFQMTSFTENELESDVEFIDNVSSLMWKLKTKKGEIEFIVDEFLEKKNQLFDD